MSEFVAAAPAASPEWMTALGGRLGNFFPDARYGDRVAPCPHEVAREREEQAARDTERAMRDAFEAGMVQGETQARAEAEAERAACDRLTLSLAEVDETLCRQMAERLAATVAQLCEATLAPMALDREMLARRCTRAAQALGESQQRLELHLHPDDIASLDTEFAARWTIVPAPDSERGTVRVEGDDAGAIDGPAQWRATLETALSC